MLLGSSSSSVVKLVRNKMFSAYSESAFNNLPQLLRLHIAGIVDFQIATLLNNLLGGVYPLSISPSRVSPPSFDSLDILQELLLFFVDVTHVSWYCKGKDHNAITERCGREKVWTGYLRCQEELRVRGDWCKRKTREDERKTCHEESLQSSWHFQGLNLASATAPGAKGERHVPSFPAAKPVGRGADGADVRC
jgi:hypothetical protein